jgi:hypothetical protein
MRVGVVFSHADSGTDPAAIRQWARDVESARVEDRQREVEQAAELGFADLSIGLNCIASSGRTHTEHLAAAVDVTADVDRIVGG